MSGLVKRNKEHDCTETRPKVYQKSNPKIRKLDIKRGENRRKGETQESRAKQSRIPERVASRRCDRGRQAPRQRCAPHSTCQKVGPRSHGAAKEARKPPKTTKPVPRTFPPQTNHNSPIKTRFSIWQSA